MVSHVFPTARSYAITVFATDKDGTTSAPVSQTLAVAIAQLQGDDLAIGGTTRSDHFILRPGAAAGQVSATLNGRNLGTFTVPGGINVYSGDGIDLLTINGSAAADRFDVQPGIVVLNGQIITALDVESTVLNGKAGNDTFTLSGGWAAINGNAGQDTLTANTPDEHLWLINDPNSGTVDWMACMQEFDLDPSR